MESTLHFFKTIRQELRELSQKIMSNEDYTQYLHQELQWENNLDEKIISLQNITLSGFKIQTQKYTTTNKTQNLELQNLETKEPVSQIQYENSSHVHISSENLIEKTTIREEDPQAQILTSEKHVDDQSQRDTTQRDTTQRDTTQISELEEKKLVNDNSKPFHMNIKEAKTKKQRRSIFRSKRPIASNLPPINIEQQAMEMSRRESLLFSDGVRNIIAQIETKNVETKKTPSLEQLSETSNITQSSDNDVFLALESILDASLEEQGEQEQKQKQTQTQNIHTERKGEANLLDVDILDLQMELFQDLPPPIPEYFDQQESKTNLYVDEMEHFFQEDAQIPAPSPVTSLDSNSEDDILDDIFGMGIGIEKDVHPVPVSKIQDQQQKESYTIEDCSNMLLSNITDSQRQDIFLQRLELHLQQHHWLESCSDAVQIIQMNEILKSQIHHLIKAYNMPSFFECFIFPMQDQKS